MFIATPITDQLQAPPQRNTTMQIALNPELIKKTSPEPGI
jgi:hypothetical protein